MKKIVLLIMLAMFAGHAAVSAPQANETAPVLQTMKLLRHHTVPDDRQVDDKTDDISPKLLRLQTRFKHQVRDLIVEFINGDPAVSAGSPSQMRTAIRARLKAMGLITHTKVRMAYRSFGHVLDVTMSTPVGHPDLLALGVVLDLSWAEEESFYILQRQPSGWVNVLSAEVNDYPHVEYAQSIWFDYVVSPSAPDGSWFLVTASVKPFRASTWQYVTYRVLAPGPDGNHPRVLVHRREQIWLAAVRDESHPCRLKVAADRFKITIPVGSRSVESDHYYRDEYRVVNGVAKRVRAGCYAVEEQIRTIQCDESTYAEKVQRTYEIIKKKW